MANEFKIKKGLIVNETDLYVSESKAGVGTTSPDANLHVSGSTSDNRLLQVGSNYLVVTGSNGYIGIGTTTPEKPLTVEWDNSDTTVTTGNGLGGGTLGTGVKIQNNSTTSDTYANLDFRANNADGRIAYQYKGSTNVGDFHFITDNSNNPVSTLIIQNDGDIEMPEGTLTVSGSITSNGSTVLTTADEGSGNGIDADTLDGQEGSFYQNASNLNAGTISDDRLPGSITSDITGNAATATKWATARTLTIGDTGKSVDGSGDVTWSRTEIGITKTNIDALNINADTVDGLNSTQFLRSDTSDTLTGALTIVNNTDALILKKAGDVRNSIVFQSSSGVDLAEISVHDSSNNHRFYIYDNVLGDYLLYSLSNSGDLVIPNGDLTVGGKITAQEFHTEFVSASIIYQSGSTKFGDTSDDVHSFTGSISILTGTDDGITIRSATRPSLFLNSTGGGTGNEWGIRANGEHFEIVESEDSNRLAYRIFDGTSPLPTTIFQHEFYTDGSNVALFISGSGNVGIGTTSPSSLLSLGNSVDAQKLLLYDNNDNFKYGFGIQNNEFRQFYPDSTSARLVFGTISDSDGTTFSEKMRIDSSGNVGIGTTSPNRPLEVVRSTSTGAFLTDGDAYQLGLRNSTTNTAAATSIAFGHQTYAFTNFISSVRTSTGANPKGDLVFGGRPSDGANFVERLRIKADGNVGIGTDSPGAKLHVSGTVANNREFQVGNNYLVVTGSNGYVGIGTTSIDNRLHVQGGGMKLEESSGNIDLRLTLNGDNKYNIGYQASGDAWGVYHNPGSVYRIYVTGSNGNVGIGTTSPGVRLDVNGAIRLLGTGTGNNSHILYFTNGAAAIARDANNLELHAYDNLVFGVSNTSYPTSTERMRIDSSGRVGIGDTPKTQHSNVTDSLNVGSHLTFQRTKDTYITSNFYYNSSDVGKSIASGWAPLYVQDVNNGVHAWYNSTAAASAADETVSIQERMRINSSGNVGIGTTSPSASLNVGAAGTLHFTESGIGSMLLKGTSGTARGMFEVHNADGASKALLQAYNGGASVGTLSETNLDIITSGSARMTISGSNGNVGIGTTSPSFKLHLSNSTGGNGSYTGGILIDNTATDTGESVIAFKNAGSNGTGTNFWWNGTNQQNFYTIGYGTSVTDGNTKLVIDETSGNVGIGVITPSQKLTVVGTISGSSDLSIDGNSVFDGTVGYNTFNSGFGGNGWRIDSNANAEFANLTVRGTFSVYELLAQQIRATNGSLLVATSGKVESTGSLTLFFDTGSQYGHGFLPGDVLLAQRLDPAGGQLKRTFLTVETVSSTGSLTYKDLSGNPPEAGQEFVRIGSTSSLDRQGHIYLTADDSNAPYIGVRDGVSGSTQFTSGTGSIEKVRMGKLSGITSNTFGTLSGYGLWASGSVYLEGGISATFGDIGGFNITDSAITSSGNLLSLKSNGQITASNALIGGTSKIAGFTVSDTQINSGTNLLLKSSGQITGSNVLFTGGKISGSAIEFDVEKFTAKGNTVQISGSNFHLLNGNITASNVDLSGNITATTGNIGGFAITSNAITGSGFYLSGSATGTGFFISASNFNVKANGQLTASAAFIGGTSKIAGFTVSDTQINSGTNLVLKSNGQITGSNVLFTGGKISGSSLAIDVTTLTAKGSAVEISGSNFHLLDGNITASNVDLSGNITATTGNIGGFAITSDAITGSGFYLSGSATGTDFFISASNFNVKANGQITGSTVLFDGGKVGGWSLDTSTIFNGTDIVIDATNKRIALNNGAMLFGFDAGGSSNHGIHINASNYWYSSGDFNIGGTNGIKYAGSGVINVGSNVNITDSIGFPSDDNLILYHSFDGKQGTDNSGNGADATIIGTLTSTGGVSGNGVEYDGTTSNYVRLDDTAINLTDFTLSAWIKSDDFSKEINTIFSFADAGNSNRLLTGFWGTTNNEWRIYLDGSLELSYADSPSTGEWYHYVVTREGSTGKLYINGVEVDSDTVVTTTINPATNGAVIGQEQDSIGGGFQATQALDGVLDEVRIYSKALSASEVRALYSSPSGPKSTTISGDQIKTGKIESNNLSSTQGTEIDLDGETIKIGGTGAFTSTDGIILDSSTNNVAKFYVGNASGNYIKFNDTADKLEINTANFTVAADGDVSLTGTITANAGNLGGFAITDSAITGSGFYLSGSATGTDFFISASNFNVKANGQLTASAAFIGGTSKIAGFTVSNTQINDSSNNLLLKSSGEITASAGLIGGWVIDSTSLSKLTPGVGDGITIDSSNNLITVSSDSPADVIRMGELRSSVYGIEAKDWSGNTKIFHVEADGSQVSGSIAGFQFNTTQINDSSGTNLILKSNGQITASAAQITGDITANTGKLFNLDVSGSLNIGTGGTITNGNVTINETEIKLSTRDTSKYGSLTDSGSALLIGDDTFGYKGMLYATSDFSATDGIYLDTLDASGNITGILNLRSPQIQLSSSFETFIDTPVLTVTGEITGSSNAIFAGNVGIGTTNPEKPLTVIWNSSDTNVNTGNGLLGGSAGSGLKIQNSSTTSDTYANLDFRANNADGRIAYQYKAANIGDFHFITDNSGAATTKVIIKDNGNVGIGNINPPEKLTVEGNISASGNIILASGQGIDFSATSNSLTGSMTSELLDDYEEGTWSPIYSSIDIDQITMSVTNAHYTRVGNLVTISAYFWTTNLTTYSIGAENLSIKGLPFTPVANDYFAISVGYAATWSGGLYPSGGYIQNISSNPEIVLTYRTTSGGATVQATDDNLSYGSGNRNRLMISAIYYT